MRKEHLERYAWKKLPEKYKAMITAGITATAFWIFLSPMIHPILLSYTFVPMIVSLLGIAKFIAVKRKIRKGDIADENA